MLDRADDPNRSPSRRTAMALAAASVSGAVMLPVVRATAVGDAQVAVAPAVVAPGTDGASGEPLREPPVLRSRDGVLDVTLRAAPVTTTVAGRPWHLLGYQGVPGGPTLRVRPGDSLHLRLINDLDGFTNLHTHGLHVSGEGDADNVFRHAEPGGELHYRIDLPHEHHAGTNWYHPHAHGNGAEQMFGLLAGALVVESAREADGVRGVSRERVMLLGSTQVDADGQVLNPLLVSQRDHVRLVNHQLDPSVDVAPGETQRWRLINTSVNDVLRLRLDGLDVAQVAADGSPFRRPRPTQEVLLPAGARADLLVTGREEGEFAFETMPVDFGFGVTLPRARLATVRCAGPRSAARPVAMPAVVRPFEDLRGARVDRRRELSMTIAGGFGFDGRPYVDGRIDQVVRLGDLEEWTVRNPTGLVHPFHIHVNPFQLTHVNGAPVDAQSYRDTVLVDKDGGSITFLIRFRRFPGRAVYHCHFATHGDLGMMGVAEVVRPGEEPVGVLGGHH